MKDSKTHLCLQDHRPAAEAYSNVRVVGAKSSLLDLDSPL